MAVVLDPQAQRRSLDDARRSLARHLHEALGDAWRVFMTPDEPSGLRPSVVVRPLDGRGGRATFAATEVTQPFAIYLYPEVGADARTAADRAFEVQEQIDRVIEQGAAQGRPVRVPMWDWEGVLRGGLIPDADDVVIDYYRVEGYTSSARPDVDDARRWSISCTLRLVWIRHAGVRSTNTVQSVGVQPSRDDPPH